MSRKLLQNMLWHKKLPRKIMFKKINENLTLKDAGLCVS